MSTWMSEKAKKRMEEVVGRFKSGDLSPFVKAARIRLPGGCPARDRSWGNKALLFAQQNSILALGYKQWQKYNRHVIEGGRASYIWKPFPYHAGHKDKNGRFVYDLDANGNRIVTGVGFKMIPVYALDQTEGEDFPFEGVPQEPPPLADVAERLGFDVKFVSTEGAPVLGWCSPTSIRVGTGETAIFFHELGHALHRRLIGEEEHSELGKNTKEVVAELFSAVMAEMYESDRTGNAWEYIKRFSDGDPFKALSGAMKVVGKLIDFVFEIEEGMDNGKGD